MGYLLGTVPAFRMLESKVSGKSIPSSVYACKTLQVGKKLPSLVLLRLETSQRYLLSSAIKSTLAGFRSPVHLHAK